MNPSYFPRNSNGLGYSNPSEDQSSLPCAAANTLFPHVLGAELLLLDPGWCSQPMGGAALHPHRAAATASVSQILTQLRGKAMAKVTDEVTMRDAQKDTKEELRQCPWLWKNTQEKQGPATKPGHIASTALLGQI